MMQRTQGEYKEEGRSERCAANGSRPSALRPPPSALCPAAPRLPAGGGESRVFERMRRRILATLLRQTFSHSRFRASLVVVLVGVLWGVMFWMFRDGFDFLRSAVTNQEIHARTVGAVFTHFFAALMLMLVFSSGVILYGSLFRSREIAFLLTTPARAERMFLPQVSGGHCPEQLGLRAPGEPHALGLRDRGRRPWYYYALLLPFIVAFIYIPVAIGAILCMWVVRHIPDRRMAVVIGGGALLAAGARGWRGVS